jgi:hypothetical protein
MLRRAFATEKFRLALQPAISMEEFNAWPRSRVARLGRPASRRSRRVGASPDVRRPRRMGPPARPLAPRAALPTIRAWMTRRPRQPGRARPAPALPAGDQRRAAAHRSGGGPTAPRCRCGSLALDVILPDDLASVGPTCRARSSPAGPAPSSGSRSPWRCRASTSGPASASPIASRRSACRLHSTGIGLTSPGSRSSGAARRSTACTSQRSSTRRTSTATRSARPRSLRRRW